MANLKLDSQQNVVDLAVSLRRAFSGIVAGNSKEYAMQAVALYGPFQLHGDPNVKTKISEILQSFVAERRFKVLSTSNRPCYETNIA